MEKRYWVRSIGKSGFRFRISDFGFPNKTRNPKTDFDEQKSFSKMDFNKGPLIEIRLGKGFRLVEIRFWISRFIGKSKIRNRNPHFPIERTHWLQTRWLETFLLHFNHPPPKLPWISFHPLSIMQKVVRVRKGEYERTKLSASDYLCSTDMF